MLDVVYGNSTLHVGQCICVHAPQIVDLKILLNKHHFRISGSIPELQKVLAVDPNNNSNDNIE